jgi:hypothetical protein
MTEASLPVFPGTFTELASACSNRPETGAVIGTVASSTLLPTLERAAHYYCGVPPRCGLNLFFCSSRIVGGDNNAIPTFCKGLFVQNMVLMQTLKAYHPAKGNITRRKN